MSVQSEDSSWHDVSMSWLRAIVDGFRVPWFI